MKMEIDGDTADRIVICSLADSMANLKEDIAQLKRKKKLMAYEKETMADCVHNLHAMELVYDYFGGNLK